MLSSGRLVKPMERLLGGRLADPARRFAERLQHWSAIGEAFTARDAARREKGCPRSVCGWLHELHDAGLVDQVEESRGRSLAKWKLAAESAVADAAVLPTVQQFLG